jgi:hypothetical protein
MSLFSLYSRYESLNIDLSLSESNYRFSDEEDQLNDHSSRYRRIKYDSLNTNMLTGRHHVSVAQKFTQNNNETFPGIR